MSEIELTQERGGVIVCCVWGGRHLAVGSSAKISREAGKSDSVFPENLSVSQKCFLVNLYDIWAFSTFYNSCFILYFQSCCLYKVKQDIILTNDMKDSVFSDAFNDFVG